MKDTLTKLGMASMLASVVLAACARDAEIYDPAVPGTVAYRATANVGVTNAQARETVDGIVNRLSTLRCDREERCNNVGGGHEYDTRSVCMSTMRGSIGNELNAYNCPMGIDAANLDRCEVAINAEHCGDALATVSRGEACRQGALCLR